MNTKAQIEAEIQTLDADQLDTLLAMIAALRANKPETPPSFMNKLKRIKIQAPEDFSTNLEHYANGEASAT